MVEKQMSASRLSIPTIKKPIKLLIKPQPVPAVPSKGNNAVSQDSSVNGSVVSDMSLNDNLKKKYARPFFVLIKMVRLILSYLNDVKEYLLLRRILNKFTVN